MLGNQVSSQFGRLNGVQQGMHTWCGKGSPRHVEVLSQDAGV